MGLFAIVSIMLDYVIRPTADSDLAAITAIYNESVVRGGATADLEPVTLDQRRAWVEGHRPRDRYPVVVIEAALEGGPQVVGFGSLSKFHSRPGYDGIAELSYYIAGAYQRQGLGTAMTEWLLDAAVQRGFTHVTAIIYADNAGSIALMRHFGFTRFGLLPDAVAATDGELHGMSYWYRTL